MEFTTWTELWSQTYQNLLQAVVEHAPKVLLAVVILVLGWLLARLLRWGSVKLLGRLGRLIPSAAIERELQVSGAGRLTAEVVGRVVFWAVLLLFAAVAGQVLALPVLSSALRQLTGFLPSLLAAGLVVAMGIVLGNLARRALARALDSAGVAQGERLSQAARFAILLIAGVVALDQIGIESTLLILTLGILLATVVGSVALAFAFGARDTVGSFIAMHYLAQTYRIGDRVRVRGVEGRIVELARTGVLLDTADGRALVPADEFNRETSILLVEGS